MSRWPTMNYYAWREWCELQGLESDVRVFVTDEWKRTAEWMLTSRRWDGQPPMDAWVRIPLWALARQWNYSLGENHVCSVPGVRGEPFSSTQRKP